MKEQWLFLHDLNMKEKRQIWNGAIASLPCSLHVIHYVLTSECEMNMEMFKYLQVTRVGVV